MNKFELMNIVTMSDLAPADKVLLIELILRSDDNGYSWPSVQRLCKARNIKHEKNFKGAERYLPGFVSKAKRGRRNTYTLNISAIKALRPAEVTLKHTSFPGAATDVPAEEGVDAPSDEANTPASTENTPDEQGANSTKNNTENTSRDNSSTADADASSVLDSFLALGDWGSSLDSYHSLNSSCQQQVLTSTTGSPASAEAGVSDEPEPRVPAAATISAEW